MMTKKLAGYAVLVAAMGMILGLLAIDVSKFSSWSEATTPGFVASVMGHISTVIAAFIAGKLVPDDRADTRTRLHDVDRTDK